MDDKNSFGYLPDSSILFPLSVAGVIIIAVAILACFCRNYLSVFKRRIISRAGPNTTSARRTRVSQDQENVGGVSVIQDHFLSQLSRHGSNRRSTGNASTRGQQSVFYPAASRANYNSTMVTIIHFWIPTSCVHYVALIYSHRQAQFSYHIYLPLNSKITRFSVNWLSSHLQDLAILIVD